MFKFFSHCAVFCVRFSADSQQIVCGTSEYSIHVFDVEQRRRIRTIVNAHEDDVNSVCFADVGSNLIYSAGDDGLVKVQYTLEVTLHIKLWNFWF